MIVHSGWDYRCRSWPEGCLTQTGMVKPVDLKRLSAIIHGADA